MGEGEVCLVVPHESVMEKESQLRIECGLSFGRDVGAEEACEAVEKMDSERQEAGLVMDNVLLDSCANSMHGGISNAGLLPVSEDYVDIVGNDDLEPSSENLPMKVSEESIREEMMNDSEHGNEESELKEVTIYSDLKPCAENQKLEVMETCNSELFTCGEEVKQTENDLCLETYRGNKSKEASNDDLYSEVLNPNQSPKQMASTLTISSQAVGVLGIDHGGCGEITSAYSRDSSSAGSLCEDEHHPDHKMEPTTTSVVLEIPKHISTTGVRKITFKFSKRKEDCSSNQAAADYIDDEYYDNPISVSDPYPVTGNGFYNHGGDPYENAEMYSGIGGSDLSHSRNRELKMSKKIVPDDYPTNVKKLLCTKILDGARVKYISVSGENEIPGIINNGGYVCGCHLCNFSKVLSAYEFELHAGTKTRHPNSHIYLENGKPIYSIIAVLKNATMSTIEDVLRGAAGSSVNEENLQVWKANLLYGTGVAYAEDIHQIRDCGLYLPDTSYPIQPNEDSLYPASLHYSRFTPFSQQSYIEAPVERKRLTKKPRHHYSSSVWEKKKSGGGGNRKRDNDLHKLLFMPNGLPDGTELAYYAKGKRILGGYKQGIGIVCSCCSTEISPSQFEAHAGWSAKRQPYRHIYTSSGLALHDIAVMLANGQSIISSGHDDMCAVCGDGEELVLCNGCPRAFHAGCLGLQFLPANDWECPYCIDKFCTGSKSPGESRPIIVRFTRVVKAPEFEQGGCVVCRSQEFSAANFDDKTVIICDQCEKEYHVGCLRESGMCDLKELPDDKWFCCDACTKIYSALETLASSGPEMIPNSVSSTLCKKHPAEALSYESNNDTQWCILSGKSRSPEHLFLLSRAAEIFRECFDPIVAASGRDLIPVMVYGRNISGQEFSGMYCVVLTVKNIVVSAALLRIFGRDVAELPLVATSRENQGKGYFRALFSCIERFLLSMDVKNLVLPAAEEAEPMWTKKLGFRKTSHEQMRKYTRDLQLTIFQGTSLLLKEVQQCAE